MICDELAEALDFTHGYVVTCEVTSEYSSMKPWPLESTKWSRSIHDGLAGSCLWKSFHKASAISAMPIGMPGWPQFVFWTAFIHRRPHPRWRALYEKVCAFSCVSRRGTPWGLAASGQDQPHSLYKHNILAYPLAIGNDCFHVEDIPESWLRLGHMRPRARAVRNQPASQRGYPGRWTRHRRRFSTVGSAMGCKRHPSQLLLFCGTRELLLASP